MQHGQPENPPPDDAEEGDQVHEPFRTSQFGLLGFAAGFEDLVEHLDLPPQGIPVELFNGGLEGNHRQIGDQFPRIFSRPRVFRVPRHG